MAVQADNFLYLKGKELQCICGRDFKTERGLKQHIRTTRKGVVMSAETGKNTGTKHGRCWSDQAKYIHAITLKRLEALSNFSLR